MGWKDLRVKGELVSFRATDGGVLAGFLCMPKGRTNVAILHLHGLNSAFYKVLPLKLGEGLARQGITFLSIQNRGSYNEFALNQSKTIRVYNKHRGMIAGGGFEKFEECVFDIQGATKYLNSIGIKRVYLQGHSTGCQKSVYYSMGTNDKAVKGIILLGAVDDYNLWKSDIYGNWGKDRQGFRKAVAFAKSKLKKNPSFAMSARYKDIRYTAKRFLSFTDLGNVEARIFNYESPKMREFGRVRVPILAVFGADDEFLLKPARESLRLLGRNTRSVDFMGVLIKNANHGFFGKEGELSSLISKWVKVMEGGR